MILEPEDVPYADLTRDLFEEKPAQRTIPFLGAGVSISQKGGAPRDARRERDRDPRITEALARLTEAGASHPDASGTPRPTLDDTTRLFAESALEMAFLMQHMRDAGSSRPDSRILERLKQDEYPPSASELSEWLSWKASYVSFDDVLGRVAERLSRRVEAPYRQMMLDVLRALTAVAGVSPAPLSLLSAYVEELRPRENVLDELGEILENKITATKTHHLVSDTARWHLGVKRLKDGGRALPAGTGHYLIMTTNYDCLMEHALTPDDPARRVPFVVLSMNQDDYRIRARFGNMPAEVVHAYEDANPPRPPRRFDLKPPTRSLLPDEADAVAFGRLAVIYKVHGCIHEWVRRERGPDEDVKKYDSIVISDKDYVVNISRLSDNDGVIPACVSDLLSASQKPACLFLGYSLRDWNVRAMLMAIRAKRGGVEHQDYGDFAVVRNFGKIDAAFYKQNKIRIIHEDLNTFTDKVWETARDLYAW